MDWRCHNHHLPTEFFEFPKAFQKQYVGRYIHSYQANFVGKQLDIGYLTMAVEISRFESACIHASNKIFIWIL